MPELIEVETYRQAASEALHRTVSGVDAFHDSYVRSSGGVSRLRSSLLHNELSAVERIGKLLVLRIGGTSVGVRFGMTGRLVVDGQVSIAELLYTTNEIKKSHIRFVVTFEDGGDLAIVDPRSVGSVELGFETSRLGIDALKLTPNVMATLLNGSRGTLKSILLNQSKISGLGNLLCDEVLWRAGISPLRIGNSINEIEILRLSEVILKTISELSARGGSHMGDLQSQRRTGGICPIDGAPLLRQVVAGRTTWWCPAHQS